eukprot:TRINITY_DN11640_c0_g1_i1.p2 TRINITY_DN11640_c0_g1~~TRINITY_DN11640_c0_g1_i1.p2  ORF type:complete len:156 (+),score=4.42 TRINITY_DN11640_c0_g1_i1:731-1198(+)
MKLMGCIKKEGRSGQTKQRRVGTCVCNPEKIDSIFVVNLCCCYFCAFNLQVYVVISTSQVQCVRFILLNSDFEIAEIFLNFFEKLRNLVNYVIFNNFERTCHIFNYQGWNVGICSIEKAAFLKYLASYAQIFLQAFVSVDLFCHEFFHQIHWFLK